MITGNECIPCFTRQCVRLAERLTEDIEIQKKIILKGISFLNEYSYNKPSPYIVGLLYDYAKKITENDDPYRDEKKKYNEIAIGILNSLNKNKKSLTYKKELDRAIRLSLAGNIIDFGVGDKISKEDIDNSIKDALENQIYPCGLNKLIEEIEKAKQILFLADNVGEMIFDINLIEKIGTAKVTYGVKSGAIVNDVTLEDAKLFEVHKKIRLIDNGTSRQGTILEMCSKEFISIYNNADLIISKGQANYETLESYNNNKIFFLLKAKCISIANHIGCKQGEFVVKRG